MTGNSPRRFLSVWLRRLSTDRVTRRLALAERPFALVGAVKNARELVAVNDRAAALGLREGLSFADACAIHPALAWAEAEPAEDARLLSRLAEWCERYTPFTSTDAPDGLMLDISGCAHLFGGEKELARDLSHRLKRLGFRARLGIADSAGCAWAVARYGKTAIVAPGAAREALAHLPIAGLRLPFEIVVGLRQLGLKTIGDVMARPRAPLAARFGTHLLQRLDQAWAREDEPITPRIPLPPFSVEQGFPEPLSRDEDLLAVLAHLTERLCAILSQRGHGARRLLASFFSVDGQVRKITIGTAAPLRDAARLSRLMAEKFALTQWQDEFGYDRIRLAAPRTEKRGAFERDFSNADEGEDCTHLVDRLAARLGPERVLAFIPQDTHIPEQAVIAVPAQSAGEFRSQGGGGAQKTAKRIPVYHHDTLALSRPIRLFERPEPIEAMAEIPDGPPVRFRWRRVLHAVARAEGPERIALPWWRDEENRALTRDYFRVEADDGARLWLYREGLYGRETANPRWYVHGVLP